MTAAGSLHDQLQAREPGAVQAASPWVLTEQIRLFQLLSLGLVATLFGWYSLSVTTSLQRQQSFLAVGISGLLVSCAGLAFWLLAGLRTVRSRRVLIHQGLVALTEEVLHVVAPQVVAHDATKRVASSDMTRFHRSTCLLVVGKSLIVGNVQEHSLAGREPCGVCQS